MYKSRQDRYWTLAFITILLLIFVVWMAFGAYQSHYLIALRILGDTTAKTLIGIPKEGRGDEWSTYLPILKQAYHENFSTFSKLKPYYERLDWFIAIPHANLSLVFLPNQAFYWLLPGPKALSLQGYYYNALFLASTVWFLSNIGVKRNISIISAFAILFSQFFQMWWTSNFPALGACILPFAVFTSRLGDLYKFGLLFWSLGHMLFGEMYPPFYISTFLALAPFTLARRRDLLTVKNLGLAILAMAAAAGAYLVLNWNFFNLIANTSYPGKRISTGGGSSYKAVLGLFFPVVPDSTASAPETAIYDFSMAGTLLPLMALARLPGMQWTRSILRLTLIVALVSSVFLIYMLVGFTEGLAKISGLYLVPAVRMHLGLSLLINFYAAVLLSRKVCISHVRVLIPAVFFCIPSVFFPATQVMLANFPLIKFLPYIPLLVWLAAFFILFSLKKSSESATLVGVIVLAFTTVAQIAVYGTFNPIMRADDILRPIDSQFIRDWRALYNKNDNKSFAIIGNYGHVLRGEGLPALEAIHLANVDPHIYTMLFPQLSTEEINHLFNQFRGIAFANVDKIDASAATVRIPIEPYAVSFAHALSRDDAVSGNLAQNVDSLTTLKAKTGVYDVRWQAVLIKPLGIDAPLILHLDCQVSSSWLTRYPLVIPGEPQVKVALQGLAGRITVYAHDESSAKTCVSKLSLSSR